MSILAHENVASPAAKMPPQIMRTCRGPFTCPTTRGGGLLLGAMLVCDRRVDCGNLTLCVQGNRENEAAWRVAIFKSLPTLPRGCQLSRPGPVGRQSLLGAEVLCGAHGHGSCNAIARIVDPNHRRWNPCQLPRHTRTDELTMQDSKHTQNKKRCVNVMIKGAAAHTDRVRVVSCLLTTEKPAGRRGLALWRHFLRGTASSLQTQCPWAPVRWLCLV